MRPMRAVSYFSPMEWCSSPQCSQHTPGPDCRSECYTHTYTHTHTHTHTNTSEVTPPPQIAPCTNALTSVKEENKVTPHRLQTDTHTHTHTNTHTRVNDQCGHRIGKHSEQHPRD